MSVSKLSQHALGSALLAWAVVSATPLASAQPMAPSGPPAAAPLPARQGAPAQPARARRPPEATSPGAQPAAAGAVAPDPARVGVATVLRAGQIVGLGLVLPLDGRVVTSRTSLGGAKKNLTLRFADGSTVVASVGHEDPATDLALLVPAKLVWTRGLAAATASPAEGASLEMFQVAKDRADRRPVRTRGPLTGTAVDLELTPPFLAGSPVVDGAGRAVGVVVQSCDRAAGAANPCKPRPRMVTVAGLRTFLRSLPATAAIPTAFLGVRGERAIGSHARGVRVADVAPGSPAAQARLVAGPEGDLILAVAGQPVTTHEELTRALGRHAPGEKVTLTIFSRGAYREVDVVLGAPPATPPPGAPSAAARGSAPPGPGAARPAPSRPAAPSPPGSTTDGAPKDFGTRR